MVGAVESDGWVKCSPLDRKGLPTKDDANEYGEVQWRSDQTWLDEWDKFTTNVTHWRKIAKPVKEDTKPLTPVARSLATEDDAKQVAAKHGTNAKVISDPDDKTKFAVVTQ